MTAAERAAASRAEQGFPEYVADPSALARAVALVRAAEGGGVTRRKKRSGPVGNRPARNASRPADDSVLEYTPCPDCPATVVGGHLEHAASCPLGLAADARMAADRAWFRDHPGAQRYLRPIAADEVAELQLAGVIPPGWDAAGDVTVIQLKPGVRTRRFDQCWMFPSRGAA